MGTLLILVLGLCMWFVLGSLIFIAVIFWRPPSRIQIPPRRNVAKQSNTENPEKRPASVAADLGTAHAYME